MLRFAQSFCRKYYDFIYRAINIERRIKLIDVDFGKPWWHVVTNQTRLFLFSWLIDCFSYAFTTVPPLLIGVIIDGCRPDYFVYFIIAWLVVLGLEIIGDYYGTLAHTQSVQGIYYNAHQLLLRIDPISHTNSAKGKILAKIFRGAEAYKEALKLAQYEVLPMIVGVITVIISFLTIDLTLGLIAFASLGALSIISAILFALNVQAVMPPCIQVDDEAKNVSAESLAQINLIRSTFISGEVNNRLKFFNNKRLYVEGTASRSYDLISSFIKISYALVFAVQGFYILELAHQGVINNLIAAALLVTFFNGTYQLLQAGQFIYRYQTQVERIKDLFQFLHTCGKQTFPVLETTTKTRLIKRDGNINLDIHRLTFGYEKHRLLFENQNFNLNVAFGQKNKLYGIIGASGQGKSTFLSIVGGQIKPNQGTVKINGTDVYRINDDGRRRLIALQNQNPSSLCGSLRRNLTFGLPRNDINYGDQHLIEILTEVDLWQLFATKEGLDTTVSEGGLTLSSGQLQRLNFANLFLRSQFYQPWVILIDEPTSNLDETSENMITRMINKLASRSIVIVAAHRLKTLANTVAILDLSLLQSRTNIQLHTHEQLAQLSPFYQKLLEGTTNSSLCSKNFINQQNQPSTNAL